MWLDAADSGDVLCSSFLTGARGAGRFGRLFDPPALDPMRGLALGGVRLGGVRLGVVIAEESVLLAGVVPGGCEGWVGVVGVPGACTLPLAALLADRALWRCSWRTLTLSVRR